MRKIFVFFAFFAVCLGVFFFSFKKNTVSTPEPHQIITEPKSIEKNDFTVDAQDVAYKLGFEQGKMAFFKQINEPIQNSEIKKEEYTVLIESQEQQKEYDEAISKGYVDGYHKAADSIHCPRCVY